MHCISLTDLILTSFFLFFKDEILVLPLNNRLCGNLFDVRIVYLFNRHLKLSFLGVLTLFLWVHL